MWSHEVEDPSFGREAKTPGGERQDMRRMKYVPRLDLQSKTSGPCFPCAVPVACWWLSLWGLGVVARLWSALLVLFLSCGVRAWRRRETGLR